MHFLKPLKGKGGFFQGISPSPCFLPPNWVINADTCFFFVCFSLSQGTPSAFLPILHSALMEYSLPLAKHIASMGIDLYSKNDLKFVNGLYKVIILVDSPLIML